MKSPSEEVCASKIIRLIQRWPIQFFERQAVAAINKRTRVNLPPFLCQFFSCDYWLYGLNSKEENIIVNHQILPSAIFAALHRCSN